MLAEPRSMPAEPRRMPAELRRMTMKLRLIPLVSRQSKVHFKRITTICDDYLKKTLPISLLFSLAQGFIMNYYSGTIDIILNKNYVSM
jgi:hypothetical protein